MNSVNLVGRLSEDPEARDSGDTEITTLKLVTDRPKIVNGKVERDQNGFPVRDSEFHRVTVFGKSGIALRQHKTKGDCLAIRGRLHYSKYEKNGAPVFAVEIIAEEVIFL